MVTDDVNELVGMIAMHDVLYHVRPPYMKLWEHKAGLSWSGQFDAACNKLKNTLVKDVMNKSIIAVTEESSLEEILDIVIKNHIRRIPVLNGKTIVGIIYVSDLFYEIFTNFSISNSNQPEPGEIR